MPVGQNHPLRRNWSSRRGVGFPRAAHRPRTSLMHLHSCVQRHGSAMESPFEVEAALRR